MGGKRKSNRGPCGYCGVNPAASTDHVIPRGIWGKSIPAQLQLPTIPACVPCNQGYSADEEYFRLFISTGVAFEHPVVRNDTWPGSIRRMLRRTPRLRSRLWQTSKPATLELPSGEILDTFGIDFDRPRINRVAEKIARGIYFYDRGVPLAEDAKLATYMGVPDELADLLAQCTEVNMSEGVVRIRRMYDEEDPQLLLCSVQFYDGYTFTVVSRPK